MADYLVKDTDMTVVADAIRTKGGTSEPLTFPDGMAQAVEAIEAGGVECDHTMEDSLLTGTGREYYNDRITELNIAVFNRNTKIDRIDLPNVESIAAPYCFEYCGASLLNLPKTQRIKDATSTIIRMPNITRLNLPSFAIYQLPSCANCEKLRVLDAGSEKTINQNVMVIKLAYSVIDTLILRWVNKPATLGGVNDLRGTAFDKGTGYIYVPKSLLEQYKAATNWVPYAEQFRAIEDYPEITGGVK